MGLAPSGARALPFHPPAPQDPFPTPAHCKKSQGGVGGRGRERGWGWNGCGLREGSSSCKGREMRNKYKLIPHSGLAPEKSEKNTKRTYQKAAPFLGRFCSFVLSGANSGWGILRFPCFFVFSAVPKRPFRTKNATESEFRYGE